MDIDYAAYAKIFKAMSDPKRLQIMDMLSNGELCASKILESFSISQPTLSHDMKLLIDTGLVSSKKVGKWTHYSLNTDKLNEVYKTVGKLMLPDPFSALVECTCNEEGE